MRISFTFHEKRSRLVSSRLTFLFRLILVSSRLITFRDFSRLASLEL